MTVTKYSVSSINERQRKHLASISYDINSRTIRDRFSRSIRKMCSFGNKTYGEKTNLVSVNSGVVCVFCGESTAIVSCIQCVAFMHGSVSNVNNDNGDLAFLSPFCRTNGIASFSHSLFSYSQYISFIEERSKSGILSIEVKEKEIISQKSWIKF